MRTMSLVGAALLAVTAWGCGSSYSNNPATPSPTGGGGGNTAQSIISIVGQSGNNSFNPNPADASQGTTVAWTNHDNTTHHIRAVDGSFDTGDIAPGATSPALMLNTNGANYYCTIHPTMVGSIKDSNGAPPPCTGLYCG